MRSMIWSGVRVQVKGRASSFQRLIHSSSARVSSSSEQNTPRSRQRRCSSAESRWDPDEVNDRRLELLLADPATAPHGGGVLVIDDSGDRKDGVKTAHVGHQWLGRHGKTDNGVVTVTTAWADERAVAADSAYGEQDGFRSELAEAGLPFVMAGPQAAPRDLGLWPGRAHPGGRGPRPAVGRAGRARRLAAGDPALPRRAR